MLVELLSLGPVWNGKTFTTGATSANILGLACGREVVIQKRLDARGITDGVGELGLLTACMKGGIKEIQVLTSMCHSSLYKAASVVGLGRAAVKEIPLSAAEPWKFDLEKLERELAREGVASIVALNAGEVNTGGYTSDGLEYIQHIRQLCDKYQAWLHVDGGKLVIPNPRHWDIHLLSDSVWNIRPMSPKDRRILRSSQIISRYRARRLHCRGWPQDAERCTSQPTILSSYATH